MKLLNRYRDTVKELAEQLTIRLGSAVDETKEIQNCEGGGAGWIDFEHEGKG